MTTDTFAKGAFAEADIDGTRVRIAGIVKGSGMIAPDMATMLAFVATDAAISAGALQTLVSLYTRSSFNAVTVDGDRSTNDTCLLFATGKAGNARIGRAGDRRLGDFRAKLEAVMLDLAHQMVRDGEGASKFVKITVEGAESAASARKIARTVAGVAAGEDGHRRRGRQLGPYRHGCGPRRRADQPRPDRHPLRRSGGRPRRGGRRQPTARPRSAPT